MASPNDPLEIPLKASIKDIDQAVEDVCGQIKKQMGEWSIVIDAPYALALEFGTSGAKSKGSKVRKVFYKSNGRAMELEVTEAFFDIYVWALRHTRSITKADNLTDAFSLASAVYLKICTSGLAPHPFIRPALFEVEDNFKEYFKRASEDYDDPMEGIANIVAEKIRENLESRHLVAGAMYSPQTDTGLLSQSIRVEPASFGETTDADWHKPLLGGGKGSQ